MASDFRMVETRTSSGRVYGVRQKVMDYIYFSAITGKSEDGKMGSCTEECGKGIFSQKCCAGVNAGPEFWYACVDRSIIPGDMKMNIANIDVKMTCVESGSMKMAGLTASALLALASVM